jgi:hypothetical protein
VREALVELEESLCAGHHPISGPVARHTAAQGIGRTRDAAAHHVHVPAGLRRTRGRSPWLVAAMIMVAIGSGLFLCQRRLIGWM